MLLFGPERSAFPVDALALSDTVVRITMITTGSLNIAVAAGVGAYEAIRQVDSRATAGTIQGT